MFLLIGRGTEARTGPRTQENRRRLQHFSSAPAFRRVAESNLGRVVISRKKRELIISEADNDFAIGRTFVVLLADSRSLFCGGSRAFVYRD